MLAAIKDGPLQRTGGNIRRRPSWTASARAVPWASGRDEDTVVPVEQRHRDASGPDRSLIWDRVAAASREHRPRNSAIEHSHPTPVGVRRSRNRSVGKRVRGSLRRPRTRPWSRSGIGVRQLWHTPGSAIAASAMVRHRSGGGMDTDGAIGYITCHSHPQRPATDPQTPPVRPACRPAPALLEERFTQSLARRPCAGPRPFRCGGPFRRAPANRGSTETTNRRRGPDRGHFRRMNVRRFHVHALA